MSVEQVWALARSWYHDRLAADFRGRTIDDALAIFRSLGLLSPFWSMDQ